jgi:hypothetical protein
VYAQYSGGFNGRTAEEQSTRTRTAMRGKTDLKSDEPFG